MTSLTDVLTSVTSNSDSAASSDRATANRRSMISCGSVPRPTSRRTNSSQLGEGLLEYVGPLVETAPQEKPLSIALREINTDLIEFKPSDPAPVPGAEVPTEE